MSLTVEDRLALQDLLIRYVYGIDVGCSEEEFLALFTEDAILESPLTGRHEGLAGIKAFRAARVSRWGKIQVRHVLTNFLIDEESMRDHARLRAYLCQFKTQLELPQGIEPRTELIFVGSYDCTARKVNDRWKLAHRSVHLDDFTPAKQHVIDSLLFGGANREKSY